MRKSNIIGRKFEQQIFSDILKSSDAEFLAIYGRRRVGKTYLVRNYFENKGFYIEIVGEKDAKQDQQLENFTSMIEEVFSLPLPMKKPNSWREAFSHLTTLIKSQNAKKKIIIFIDELPWMSTKRSGLIQALDHIWNTEWSKLNHLKLIVCGSAASWMLDNLIHAKGGLHNRITKSINLTPFNLKETKEYFTSKRFRLNENQILLIYMVMGGIPYYLKQTQKGFSADQNIQKMCFSPDGLLFKEYKSLFSSLFNESEIHHAIIETVIQKRNGMSKEELLRKLNKTSGGTFNKKIKELEASGFIERYVPFGKLKRDQYIRVIDEFLIFYHYWIKPVQNKPATLKNTNYWNTLSNSSSWNTWLGYAYESICQKHIQQILLALKLTDKAGEIGHWSFPGSQARKGAQIDLLIDRSDKSITICEIKFSHKTFIIDKKYAKELLNKIDCFEEFAAKGKQVFLSFITTQGLKNNMYSEELVSSEVKLSDLFS